MDVKGKGAFVTGGAKGIGRAIVEALLQKGAKATFCDIIEEQGKATEKELREKYGADNVFFTPCDVTDKAQLLAAFQQAVANCGSVDIHVNNAGVVGEDDDAMDRTIAINQVATMKGTRLAEEHMRKDKGGRGGVIINIASVAGLYSLKVVPVYVATKHAVIGYTTSVAKQHSPETTGVRLCCVCPWPVRTDIIKGIEYVFDPDFGIKEEEIMAPSVIGMVVVKMVEDADCNGQMMEVWSRDHYAYRRRQVVDKDGKKDAIWCDADLKPQLKGCFS